MWRELGVPATADADGWTVSRWERVLTALPEIVTFENTEARARAESDARAHSQQRRR